MDAISLVAYTYEVGSALVERCQFVKRCHTESARIALRTLRVLAQLDKAATISSSPELDASLVDLRDVLEQAQDLVAKCHKVKGISAALGALVRANTLKGELIRVERDLDRIANDLQLPILTDIRRAVESLSEREHEAGGREGGIDAEVLEQTVRDTIRKELIASIGAGGRSVEEVINGQLSQVYAAEQPAAPPADRADPSPVEPVGAGGLRCSGHGEECALRTTKKPVRSRSSSFRVQSYKTCPRCPLVCTTTEDLRIRARDPCLLLDYVYFYFALHIYTFFLVGPVFRFASDVLIATESQSRCSSLLCPRRRGLYFWEARAVAAPPKRRSTVRYANENSTGKFLVSELVHPPCLRANFCWKLEKELQ